jgi:hypothetical protein
MLRGTDLLREYDVTRRLRHPISKTLVRCALIALACGTMASKCEREPDMYRGSKLQVATLPPDEVVGTYRAALAAALPLGDPALFLLVDPTLLPRGEGLAGGDAMPADVRSGLQRQRLVSGTCQVPVQRNKTPLVCRAARPGYVVRFSAPFALAAGRRDSVQVHLVVQQYAIPKGPVAERLRFERAYRVARRGQGWRAVSEARLPQP